MKLFVYGTLINPRIQARVFGRTIESKPAVLKGFELHSIHPTGAPYKTIKKADGETANGWILDINQSDLLALDIYEGCPSLYVRKKVQVSCNITPSVESIVDAYTYIATEYDYKL